MTQQTLISFIKFGIVGLVNTAIDISLFFFLYKKIGLGIIPSNVISFSFAVTNSYLMNKYWSFIQTSKLHKASIQFIKFVTISSCALILNTAILIIGDGYVDLLILKLLAAVITTLFNFLMYRYYVFGIPKDR